MAEMKAEAAVEGVEIGGLAENMVDLEVNSEVVGVKKIKEKRKMWRLRVMEEEVKILAMAVALKLESLGERERSNGQWSLCRLRVRRKACIFDGHLFQAKKKIDNLFFS